MTTNNDGGPAFPLVSPNTASLCASSQGMSLRDWFAGMAMQGMLGCPHLKIDGSLKIDQDNLARAAYFAADAMLRARDI